jgi:hypothetical protein
MFPGHNFTPDGSEEPTSLIALICCISRTFDSEIVPDIFGYKEREDGGHFGVQYRVQ